MLTKKKRWIHFFLSLFTVFSVLGFGVVQVVSAKDVTDETKIQITDLKITKVNQNDPINRLIISHYYEFKFNWDASAYGASLQSGDFFEVQIPDDMVASTDQVNQELDIKNASDETVAKATILPGPNREGGVVRFVFTDYADTHGNIKGNFNMRFSYSRERFQQGGEDRLVAKIGKQNYPIDPDGTIKIIPAQEADPNEIISKWSDTKHWKELKQIEEKELITDPTVLDTISKGATRWVVRLNLKKENLNKATFTDELFGDELGNITYIPGTFILQEVELNSKGEITRVINTRNISSDIQMAADMRSFTYYMGDQVSHSYFLSYYTTYPEGSKLYPRNRAKISYTTDSKEAKSSFKESKAGGNASGDNASRIKIVKFGKDAPSVPLANATFELYYEDKTTPVMHEGQPLVLTTDQDGTAQSPKLIAGTYYLKEIVAPSGYQLPGSDHFFKAEVDEDGVELYIENERATTSINVMKSWIGGPKAESVKVKLLADAQELADKEIELSEANNWSHTFTDLPKYAATDGHEIHYTVKEEAVAGYTAMISGDAASGYTITNTYHQMGIPVVKKWDDADNQDGKRPTAITVKLLADGADTGKTLELSVANNWAGRFTELEVAKGGKTIDYQVVEVGTVSGYTAKVTGDIATGFTITNSYVPETVAIKVTKNWDDADNQDGKRPTSIRIHLLADGTKIDSKEVRADALGKWEAYFTDLPKFKNGKEVNYTVTEEAVAEYETLIGDDKFTITNSHVPDTIKISGTKIWVDDENKEGLRSKSVKIQILQGDKVVDEIETSEATGWNFESKPLPKYDKEQEIVYTVKEIGVASYESRIEQGDDGRYTVTNELKGTISISGEKTWNDSQNQDGKRPKSIQVALLADGKETGQTATVQADTDGKWTYRFDHLERYKNGKAIVYTVKEVSVPDGYTAEVNGMNLTNTYVPATVQIEGFKKWDDDENKDKLRPSSIQVRLLADGKATGQVVTVSDATGWTYRFANLPKMANGRTIIYTVEEVSVPSGYTSKVEGWNITNTRIPNRPPTPPTPEKPNTPPPSSTTPKTSSEVSSNKTEQTKKKILPATGAVTNSLTVALGLITLFGVAVLIKRNL